MSTAQMKSVVEAAFDARDTINFGTKGEVREAVDAALHALDRGELRVAEKFNGEWIVNQGARLGPLVAGQPGVARLCHPEAVEAVFRAAGRRHGFAAWILLFFALWHRIHIEGIPAEGDAFALLAAR